MKLLSIILLVLLFIHQSSYTQEKSEIFDSQKKRNLKADEYYKLGNDNLYSRNYKESIIYFDEAIKLRPKKSSYYIQRAQAKELANKKIGALTDYEIAIKIDPVNPNAYFKRGLFYYSQKNYETAIIDFNRLLEEDFPKETKAIIFKGNITSENEEFAFNRITTIDNMRGDIYNARANALTGMKKFDLAMQDYDSAISINSGSANYLVNRGLLNLQMKDTANAKIDFRKSLKIDEKHHAALYNLSLIADAKEKTHLNTIIFSQEQFNQAYSRRGFEKFMKNDFAGALNDYDSALILNPKCAKDLMNRGLVKMKLEKYLEANKDFITSLEQNRNLIRNYVHLGNNYQILKDFQNAINYYQLYLSLNGDDASVYYNKGIAEYNSGKNKNACESLKKALDLGKENTKKVIESVCK